MARRTIQLHVFASAKGGVGKSTLAVVAARLHAAAGRHVALLDLDFTGTSLADGLALVAPDLEQAEDGKIDLTRPPRGTLTREETKVARRRRFPGGKASFLPFLNDVFDTDTAHEDAAPLVESLCWRTIENDTISYFPSSALAVDVESAVEAIFYRDSVWWPARLSWVLWRLLEQRPDLEVIVLDLPPGLFGDSIAALSLGARLVDKRPLRQEDNFSPLMVADLVWRVHPWLVTSPDHNSLLATLEHTLLYNGEIPGIVPLVNRALQREAVNQWIRGNLQPELRVSSRLKFVDDGPQTMGRIFAGTDVTARSLEQAEPLLHRSLSQIFLTSGGA